MERICRTYYEHHQVVGLDKGSIKPKISELKRTRDEALAARDHGKLHNVRRQIHRRGLRLTRIRVL